MVKYHKLGTDPAGDPLVYSDPQNPKRNISVGISDDERFMFLVQTESTSGNSLSFKEMKQKEGPFIPLMTSFDYDFSVIDNLGDQLYVITNYKAPRYRLLKIDAQKPQEEFWTELIPEKEYVLTSASLAGGKLVLNYLRDAFTHIEICNYDGTPDYEFPLPGIGTSGGPRSDKDDPEAFYTFTSYNTPGEVYRYDFTTRESSLYYRPEVKFNPDDFQVDQFFYPSKDGTKVPMFLFTGKEWKTGTTPLCFTGMAVSTSARYPILGTAAFLCREGRILAVPISGEEENTGKNGTKREPNCRSKCI